jgi:hypothetical protein
MSSAANEDRETGEFGEFGRMGTHFHTQALNPSTQSFLGHGFYGIIHYLSKGATLNRSDLAWLLKEMVLCLLAYEGREISTIDLHQGLKLTFKVNHTEIFKKPYNT